MRAEVDMECAWRTTTRASKVISSTNVAWKRLGRRGRHPFIHPSIRSFIHTFIHTYLYTSDIPRWAHARIYTCAPVHLHVYTGTHAHTHTYIYTCMCYHLHLHVCQLYTCTQQPFGIYVGVIVWIGDRNLGRLRWVWLLLARSRQLRLQLLPLLWHSAFVTKQKLWEPCSQGSGCD